jgi:hypothetical protein
MNNMDQNWRKLVETARHAATETAPAAPFGFSTRVAARWLAGGRPLLSAWELLSLRSLGLALLVMLVSLGVSFSAVQDQFTPEPAVPADIVTLLAE